MIRSSLLLLLPLIFGCTGKDSGDTESGAGDDADQDGYPSAGAGGDDCDDSDPTVNPGAGETYYDGIDNDCDASTVDDDQDADGSPVALDCNDTDPEINPDAEDVCDGVDNNCSGTVDEGSAIDGWSDLDGDGYGDPLSPVSTCDADDITVVLNDGDCDDANADIHPGAAETCSDVVDLNCDGSVGAVDNDSDGFFACEECDDGDATAYPGAPEVCDGHDNDCDGGLDNNAVDATTWYEDSDADTYGADAVTVATCAQPSGYVAIPGDCDDADPSINPGVVEDCASSLDLNCDGSVGFEDADADGYAACEECDDSDATAFPGGVEVCDGVDNDCNGTPDDSPSDPTTYYADADADGFGDGESSQDACAVPVGYVNNSTDCDDANLGVNPDASDVCDTVDNDCDATVDGDATYFSTFYADSDTDTYGDSDLSMVQCFVADGYVSDGTDCDDGDAAVSPAAAEVCDLVDNDCEGTVDLGAIDGESWYSDVDADGYGAGAAIVVCDQPASSVAVDGDCDDAQPAVNPDAVEVCDSVDNDCNDVVDDGATDAQTFYADVDGDGYGNADDTIEACGSAPAGYVADGTDCDDTSGTEYPGAPEACDGVDNNCTGGVDESGAEGEITFYADGDGDGYGNEADTLSACTAPAGYGTDASDCDDTDSAVSPAASEADNGGDDDCDLWVDEDFVAVGDLVITEIARQTYVGGSSSNADGQWFELYNVSSRTVDLSYWYIIRADSSTNDAYFIDPDEHLTVAPGDYAVLCKTNNYESDADASYPLLCDYVWGDEAEASSYSSIYHDNTFNMQRDLDSLSLYIEGGSSVGTRIDTISWSYTGASSSDWPRDGGRSMGVDPDLMNSVSNNTNTNWCSTSNTTPYSWYKSGSVSDYGTPGAANYNCF